MIPQRAAVAARRAAINNVLIPVNEKMHTILPVLYCNHHHNNIYIYIYYFFYIYFFYGAQSHWSPVRLQRHKDTLISSLSLSLSLVLMYMYYW